MSHYDSDESTLRDEEPRRGRQEYHDYHAQAEDGYYEQRTYDGAPPEQKSAKSKFATVGKFALIAGVIAGVLHLYNKEKTAEREREHRRKRRRNFEKAKKARRREEARRERQQDRSDSLSPVPNMRRIGYGPAQSRSPSPSRPYRAIEPPPGRSGRSRRRDTLDERDYPNDPRSRSRAR